MNQSIVIRMAPDGIDPEFAAALVGLAYELQPELVKWSEAIGQERLYYFLRSSDVLATLTTARGVLEATRHNQHLIFGRVIRIPKGCAEIVAETVRPETI